jgi:hypothetical protein
LPCLPPPKFGFYWDNAKKARQKVQVFFSPGGQRYFSPIRRRLTA